jgi:presqualene diphosphate synthase
MDTIEHLCAPILESSSRNAEIGAPDDKNNAIAVRPAGAGTSFSWAMHLLSVQRRKAVYALHAFCREVDDIAEGAASASLKQILFTNWRSEIADLYGGRPRHAVTLGLNQAIHLYGLRCHDFLAIIDGAEMKAQTDILAPSFAQLDHYCECTAVAVCRLSVRIFGEETPAGERVAAELGRALQFTNILRDLTQDAKRHRLFLPRELLRDPRHIRNDAELGAGAAGVRRSVPRFRRTRQTPLRGCRRGNCGLPSVDDAPAAVMLGTHRALLEELVARGWEQLDVPVRISFWRELALLLRHGLTGR